jgi:hypothetical protein
MTKERQIVGFRLQTSREAGERKKRLGLAPGRRFRGFGFDPDDSIKRIPDFHIQDIEDTNDRLDNRDVEKRSKTANVSRTEPTEFERAVIRYLACYAYAVAKSRSTPKVPDLVKARYSGADLRKWEKNILQTKLYKKVRQAVHDIHLNAAQ